MFLPAMLTLSFTCNFVAVVLVSLFIVALCSRWHCAVVEIRSLVLARDDGVAGTCAKRVLQVKTLR